MLSEKRRILSTACASFRRKRRKVRSSLPSGRESSPPEVKLSEGSARGEASFRKPPEVKLPEGRSLPSESRQR